MTLALYILFALAGWHYLWDGILAPSFRVGFRFELFTLRDRIRAMRMQCLIDAKQFRHIEDSLNTAIQAVRFIDLTGLLWFRQAYNHDEGLRQRIDDRMAFLALMPPEVTHIFRGASTIVYKALLVNIGAWLIPLLVVYAPIHWAFTKVQQLVTLTEYEVANIGDLSSPPSVPATG